MRRDTAQLRAAGAIAVAALLCLATLAFPRAAGLAGLTTPSAHAADSSKKADTRRSSRARRAGSRARRGKFLSKSPARRGKRARKRRGKVRPAAPARPFSPDSFWNKPLPDDAPLDMLSEVYVANLQRQVAGWGPYINTTRYGIPVYTVAADQPTVRVALPNPTPPRRALLQAAWERVPLPSNARPSPDSDGRLVVWQPSTDTMWEFWRLRRGLVGWQADFGGRMESVSTNIGTYTDPAGWGASASGIPILGGLMRIDELRARRIDHGLALTIPEVRARVYSWPAARTDGTVESPTAIPQGTRFRLDPKLDVASLDVHPLVRAMARAAQRYGLVVRDRGGGVGFYGEDPGPLGHNPYAGAGGIFGGNTPSELMRQFPWGRLQALRTDLRVEP